MLVANAGLPGTGRLTEFTADQLTGALRVNLEAPMLLARALYPAMVERGSGHLVFVSSLSGKVASPRTSIYNATKFGLRGFALGLRADLDPQGIGVSIVSPGFDPRSGHVRRLRRQASAGHRHRRRPSRSAPPSVKAIERDKVEIVVAPLQQRALAHFALASPGIAVRAAERRGRPEGAPKPSPTVTQPTRG